MTDVNKLIERMRAGGASCCVGNEWQLLLEVERLRGEPVVGLCIDHAGIYVTDKKCPYCKLTRLLDGLENHARQTQDDAIWALIKEARGE